MGTAGTVDSPCGPMCHDRDWLTRVWTVGRPGCHQHTKSLGYPGSPPERAVECQALSAPAHRLRLAQVCHSRPGAHTAVHGSLNGLSPGSNGCNSSSENSQTDRLQQCLQQGTQEGCDGEPRLPFPAFDLLSRTSCVPHLAVRGRHLWPSLPHLWPRGHGTESAQTALGVAMTNSLPMSKTAQ